MPGALHPEVDGAPDRPGGVAADVVAQQIVRQEQIPGPAPDLLRLGERDRRVAARREERVGAVLAEVRRMCQVGAGPHPEIAGVLVELVGHQHPGEQREGARPPVRFGGEAVEVVHTGLLRVRRDVEHGLHLAGRFQRAGAGQGLGQGPGGAAGQQRGEGRNALGGGEVVVRPAYIGAGRTAFCHPVDDPRPGGHQLSGNGSRDQQESALRELGHLCLAQSYVIRHEGQASSAPAAGATEFRGRCGALTTRPRRRGSRRRGLGEHQRRMHGGALPLAHPCPYLIAAAPLGYDVPSIG